MAYGDLLTGCSLFKNTHHTLGASPPRPPCLSQNCSEAPQGMMGTLKKWTPSQKVTVRHWLSANEIKTIFCRLLFYGINCFHLLMITVKKIKSSLYSRYYAEACNEWRDPSPQLSAWATQLQRNVAAVAKRLLHCVWFDGSATRLETKASGW